FGEWRGPNFVLTSRGLEPAAGACPASGKARLARGKDSLGNFGSGAMTRIASCQCRGFCVVVEAQPDIVCICHCHICQRRTGVPLTCNAYFPRSKVRLEGEHRIYTRDCPEGRKLHNHFCPACGSTVGWTLDLRPNQFGVAVGCFDDRNFPPPVASSAFTAQ